MLGGVGVDGQARLCMGGAWLDDVVMWCGGGGKNETLSIPCNTFNACYIRKYKV